VTAEREGVLAVVRRSVRGVLESTPAFAQAAPTQRRELAQRMVKVAMMGADLAADERAQTAAVAARAAPLSAAQEFGEAAKRAGQTFQDIRNAIDFPTYVQSLITGVFQAITSSNIQQLTAIGDMLDAVSRTEDEFTAENIRDGEVIAWATGKLPFLRAADGALRVQDGVDLDEKLGEIAAQLRVSPSEVDGLDEDDLLGSLGPLIRRRIGRERQQMLATMVQMGLQRVVVDEGRLHASMDMRVDTRSALAQQQARREELDIDAGASAQFGMGAWGASAHLNVGYNKIQSDSSTSREEIDTRAGLRSSVDLAFRTDQIPLDRMASPAQRARLDASSRVPVSVADGTQSIIANEPASGGAGGASPMNRQIQHANPNQDSQQAATARQEAARREDAERARRAAAAAPQGSAPQRSPQGSAPSGSTQPSPPRSSAASPPAASPPAASPPAASPPAASPPRPNP
jgi:hypothetical protein